MQRPPKRKGTLLAGLMLTMGRGADAALAQKRAAASKKRRKPGCTSCEAIERRERARDAVAALKG